MIPQWLAELVVVAMLGGGTGFAFWAGIQDLRLSRQRRRAGDKPGAKNAQDDALMLFAAGLAILGLVWSRAVGS